MCNFLGCDIKAVRMMRKIYLRNQKDLPHDKSDEEAFEAYIKMISNDLYEMVRGVGHYKHKMCKKMSPEERKTAIAFLLMREILQAQASTQPETSKIYKHAGLRDMTEKEKKVFDKKWEM